MTKIALLTTECAQVGAVMEHILRTHGDRIGLVVASDINRPSRGSVLAQARQNLSRSGPEFLGYLMSSFVFYEQWLAYDRLRSAVLRKPRRRKGLRELCDELGIRFVLAEDVNGDEVISALREESVDLITIYWFDQILKQRTMDAAPSGVVNFHAARLPNCRGLFPVLFSASDNEGRFGITAHDIVDETVDTGPILGQLELTLDPTARTVLEQDDAVNRAGAVLYTNVIEHLEERRANAVPQTEGTYFSYPTREQVGACHALGLKLWSARGFRRVCTSRVVAGAAGVVEESGDLTALAG